MTTPTPDETAIKVLSGELVRKTPRFMEFRQSMIDEHPTSLTEEEIHDLYQKHVTEYQHLLQDERTQVFRDAVNEAQTKKDSGPWAQTEEGLGIMRALRLVDHDGNPTKKGAKAIERVTKEPKPLKVDKPEYDMIGERKPVLDTTLGEAVGKIGRFARALVRNVLVSRDDTRDT